MTLKFNNYSYNIKGRKTVFGYLLDRIRVQMNEALLIKGDVKFAKHLINVSKRKNTYVSGGLMFHKDDKLTEEQEREIMDDFEKMVFCGMDKSQYHIVWIKHVDKGRTELNFVIPRTELSKGIDLDVYSHKRDLPIFDMWKNGVNKKYGLADPNAESRKRTAKERMEKKKHRTKKGDFENSFINSRLNLDEKLQELVTIGVLTSRKEIMKYLKSEGFEVKRAKGGKGLIVSGNNLGDEVLELNGRPIYHKAFESLEYLKEAAKPVDVEIKHDKSVYDEYLQTRSERHLKRYSVKKEVVESDSTPSKEVTQPIAFEKKEENDSTREVARRSESRDSEERQDNRGTADSVQGRTGEFVGEFFALDKARSGERDPISTESGEAEVSEVATEYGGTSLRLPSSIEELISESFPVHRSRGQEQSDAISPSRDTDADKTYIEGFRRRLDSVSKQVEKLTIKQRLYREAERYAEQIGEAVGEATEWLSDIGRKIGHIGEAIARAVEPVETEDTFKGYTYEELDRLSSKDINAYNALDEDIKVWFEDQFKEKGKSKNVLPRLDSIEIRSVLGDDDVLPRGQNNNNNPSM